MGRMAMALVDPLLSSPRSNEVSVEEVDPLEAVVVVVAPRSAEVNRFLNSDQPHRMTDLQSLPPGVVRRL